MGQERYFETTQEAEQFMGNLVVEIFRYETSRDSSQQLPTFICFDFVVTEAMEMISQATNLLDEGLSAYSPIYVRIVKDYINKVRPMLGSPFSENVIQSSRFREELGWRNRSIEMVENILNE